MTRDVPENTGFLQEFDVSFRPEGSRRGRLRPITIAMLVLAVIGLAAAGYLFTQKDSDSKTADEWLQQGLDAHVAGDLDAALDAYEHVLSIDDRNVYANYNIGLINYGRGNIDVAEAKYQASLSADPSYMPALFNLAVLKFESGAYQEAVDLYREVIVLEPSNANAHLNLGFALRSAGDVEGGDAEIAAAIELDPSLASSVDPTTDATTPASDSTTTPTSSTSEMTTTSGA